MQWTLKRYLVAGLTRHITRRDKARVDSPAASTPETQGSADRDCLIANNKSLSKGKNSLKKRTQDPFTRKD